MSVDWNNQGKLQEEESLELTFFIPKPRMRYRSDSYFTGSSRVSKLISSFVLIPKNR